MNAPSPPADFARHQFTLDDVLAMIRQGLLDRRVQLLDGEIYDMPADGDKHILYTMGIAQIFMAHLLAKPYFVGVQTTLRLSARNAPSPDIYVLAGGPPHGDVAADRILLVVEVADSSLDSDLTDSAARYARHGVREYWVVDANAREILVHRDPFDGAYPPPQRIEADKTIAPRLLPDIPIRLAAFE
jgi:Uma2 family endonuclease